MGKTSSVYSPSSNVSPGGNRAGFTLVELLVTIAILFVLAALMLTGITAARNRARATEARRHVYQLKKAFDTYYGDRSGFPDITDPDDILDSVRGHFLTGVELIQALRGRYMDFHGSATNFIDPWGDKYRVAFDTDYDGQITVPDRDGDMVDHRMGVAAWSAGPDGEDGTKDDVSTWR